MAKKKLEQETGRPSVYLLNKCEAVDKVLDFFLATEGSYCRTLAEKRAVFLAQIDFWDWEIENLIFSFDSFMERVKAWNSTGSLCACLLD